MERLGRSLLLALFRLSCARSSQGLSHSLPKSEVEGKPLLELAQVGPFWGVVSLAAVRVFVEPVPFLWGRAAESLPCPVLGTGAAKMVLMSSGGPAAGEGCGAVCRRSREQG